MMMSPELLQSILSIQPPRTVAEAKEKTTEN